MKKKEWIPQEEWYRQYEEYLRSPEWFKIRDKVKERDHYKCQHCGCEYGDFNVHHITYKNFGHEQMEDLVLLCDDCRVKAHAKRAD
ncbi:MAG: hypothetical protein ACREQ5_11655 [Candidatus Dormibacteria bacterium]